MSYAVFDRLVHVPPGSGGRGAGSHVATLAITPAGRFELNARAKHWLGAAPRVRLWFDPEARRIAIEPCAAGVEHSYALTRSRSIAAISAAAFLRHYQLRSPERRHYPVAWNEQRGWLEVSLEAFAG
jgi:hypothetical protein